VLGAWNILSGPSGGYLKWDTKVVDRATRARPFASHLIMRLGRSLASRKGVGDRRQGFGKAA
jgi:hypothetical protein